MCWGGTKGWYTVDCCWHLFRMCIPGPVFFHSREAEMHKGHSQAHRNNEMHGVMPEHPNGTTGNGRSPAGGLSDDVYSDCCVTTVL